MVLTDTILMVRPLQFSYNEQTAETNAFQQKIDPKYSVEVSNKAMEEFDAFVHKLKSNHINVLVYDDTNEPIKPDAVFPNNWLSTHLDGKIVLYPMCHENRRPEKREDIVESLKNKFKVSAISDFSYFELNKQYIEGTGSVVLDRQNKLMYACLSPRTDLEALETVAEKLGYTPIPFHSVDENGQAIYHTNVMMSVGDEFVVICLESIKEVAEKAMLLGKFDDTAKQVIEISYAQMNQMAGNMLQLRNTKGQKIEVMSTQAFNSLSDFQMTQLLMHSKIIYSDLFTIEKYGGGSARCMIAEIFLQE